MNPNEDDEYKNPFSRTQLGEHLVRDKYMGDIIGNYSSEIFSFPEVKKIIQDPHNHFVIGVPGAGKTMILGFLRAECLSTISVDEKIKSRFSNIFSILDKERPWGIYFSIRANEFLVYPNDFTGFNISDEKWIEYYSDFLNTYLLNKISNHVCASSPIGKKTGDWLNLTNSSRGKIEKIIKDLTSEWGIPKKYQNVDGLCTWTSEKLWAYHYSLKVREKFDMSGHAPFFKIMGYPIIKLIQEFNDNDVFNERKNVHIIIDEYDYLAECNKTDFSRAINSFIGDTVRSAVPNLQMKVGTRPSGWKDSKTLEGTMLRMGREFHEINLGHIFRKHRGRYDTLLEDMANKRLESIPWFKKNGTTRIKELLEEMDPVEEAERYAHYRKDKHEHLDGLRKCCSSFSFHEKLFDNLKGLIINSTEITLHQKYLSIFACRKLRKIKINEKKKKEKYDLTRVVKEVTHKLRKPVAYFKYNGISSDDASNVTYAIKDIREPSLFQIASSYHKEVSYFGFKRIAYMSEGIPLNFLRLLVGIFEEFRHKTGEMRDVGSFEIDILTQTRGITKTSFIIRDRVTNELKYGRELLDLIDQLCYIFRFLLLHPRAHYPSPNQFSIPQKEQWLDDNGSADYKRLRSILNEAIDWAYLSVTPHKTKVKGGIRSRTKFRLNSILSPAYDLSIPHLKEPVLLTEDDLLDLMSTDEAKIKEARKRIVNLDEYPPVTSKDSDPEGIKKKKDASQTILFEFGDDS